MTGFDPLKRQDRGELPAKEEGEYEYVSDKQGATPGKEETHAEPAVLYQPQGEDESDTGAGRVVPVKGSSADHKIPVVNVCIKFEWPSGPSPAPGYGPIPEVEF